jgi:hypothetical protein
MPTVMAETIRAGVPDTAEQGHADLTVTASVTRRSSAAAGTTASCTPEGWNFEAESSHGPDPGESASRSGGPQKVAEGAHGMRPVSARFLGHWLRGACVSARLAGAEEEAFPEDRSEWPNVKPYAATFGVQTRPPVAAFVCDARLAAGAARPRLELFTK